MFLRTQHLSFPKWNPMSIGLAQEWCSIGLDTPPWNAWGMPREILSLLVGKCPTHFSGQPANWDVVKNHHQKMMHPLKPSTDNSIITKPPAVHYNTYYFLNVAYRHIVGIIFNSHLTLVTKETYNSLSTCNLHFPMPTIRCRHFHIKRIRFRSSGYCWTAFFPMSFKEKGVRQSFQNNHTNERNE
jgi:hypothetical protein